MAGEGLSTTWAARALPPASVAATGVAAGFATDWHVAANDFWGNVILAGVAQPLHPSTWYSGFFPFGYALLLRAAGRVDTTLAAYLISIAAATVTVSTTSHVARHIAGSLWAIAAGISLAFWPAFFQYATQPGPDMLMVSLVTGAVAALLRMTEGDPAIRRDAWIGGVLLGLACLCRYHAGGVVLGTWVALAVLPGLRRTGWWPAALVPVAAMAAQAAVSVAAGRGPFETAQGFNVLRAMYGVDWLSLSATTTIPGIGQVIAADPARFARVYARSTAALSPYLLPSLMALITTRRNPALNRKAWLLAILGAVYILCVSLAASSRAVLVMLPLTVLSAVVALGPLRVRADERGRWGAVQAAALAMCALATVGNAATNVRALQRRAAAHRQLTTVEVELLHRDIVRSRQVFTTDLSFYLPHVPDRIPYTNGGWYRMDVAAYDREYPALCITTPECLVRDARAHGVRAIVLPPGPPLHLRNGDEWPPCTTPLPAPPGWIVRELCR